MGRNLHVAVVQTSAGPDRNENVAQAYVMADQAARQGAELVVLPEMFASFGDLAVAAAGREPLDGPLANRFAGLARERAVWLLAGTLCETVDGSEKAANTAVLFSPQGTLAAAYRKLHLFDVERVHGLSIRESDHIAPGDDPVVFDAPWCATGFAICYDLRFPELFRALRARGANVVLVPAAFTDVTGPSHWRELVRARAIENQCFVVAANQCGRHNERSGSFGHSLIVDPWGAVIAEAGERPAIVCATLKLDAIETIRAQMPCWDHRRLP